MVNSATRSLLIILTFTTLLHDAIFGWWSIHAKSLVSLKKIGLDIIISQDTRIDLIGDCSQLKASTLDMALYSKLDDFVKDGTPDNKVWKVGVRALQFLYETKADYLIGRCKWTRNALQGASLSMAVSFFCEDLFKVLMLGDWSYCDTMKNLHKKFILLRLSLYTVMILSLSGSLILVVFILINRKRLLPFILLLKMGGFAILILIYVKSTILRLTRISNANSLIVGANVEELIFLFISGCCQLFILISLSHLGRRTYMKTNKDHDTPSTLSEEVFGRLPVRNQIRSS